MSVTFSGGGVTISGGGWTLQAPPAGNKAIFGYGNSGSATAITNLVSNTGVVATDTTGVGTARQGLAASSFSA